MLRCRSLYMAVSVASAVYVSIRSNAAVVSQVVSNQTSESEIKREKLAKILQKNLRNLENSVKTPRNFVKFMP